MSRNNKSVTSQATKYCKVCHDSGETETEYRSHFTRESNDPKSKVICPTLLALECRYCFKNGHTVKYCPVLKDKERVQKRESYTKKVFIVKDEQETKGKFSKNSFACLDCDSEEETEEPNQKIIEEFPALTNNTMKIETKLNYASALAKPKPVSIPVQIKVPNVEQKQEQETIVLTKNTIVPPKLERVAPVVAPWATNTAPSKINWTAWDSDEEDDDDDDEETTNEIVDAW